MFDWITTVIGRMGYVGIALLTLLENLFPPIPSELIMPLAGFVATRGQLGLWGAILAGTAGSLAGAIAWYAVGRMVGEARLRRWADRHGRWLTIDREDIDRAAAWFERHGAWAVLAGRLIPTVRTFISIPAGFARMPFWRFTVYSAIGTLLWTGALTYAGYVLGRNYRAVGAYLGPASWVVVGAIVAWYLVRVIRGGHGERRRSDVR